MRRIGIFLVVVWSVLPIYWAFKTSIQTEGDARDGQYLPLHPTLDNYTSLLSGDSDTANGIRSSLLNIVIECGAATIVTVVLAALAAYAFARMTFRGHTILFYRIMSDLYLVNTYTGVVLVYVSGFLPLATWVLHNYFSGLPSSIEEAGLIDGANRLQVFWHLVLPLARPGIISTALITFLFAWAQFLFPLVLTTDTSTQPLTVVIASLQGRHVVPTTLLSAAGMIAIAVPAVVALVFNRYIVNGLLAGSTK
jgi:multiple sugar transport system permease protein